MESKVALYANSGIPVSFNQLKTFTLASFVLEGSLEVDNKRKESKLSMTSDNDRDPRNCGRSREELADHPETAGGSRGGKKAGPKVRRHGRNLKQCAERLPVFEVVHRGEILLTRRPPPLEPIWKTVHTHFHATPDITGAQLFARAQEGVKKAGFEWGNSEIAGHLVGHFPHERIPRDKIALYITEQNEAPMRSAGKDGLQRHWILEVYLQDEKREFQAFFEQLLTVE
ncbi:hypothetical protein B0H13DRAFT_2520831 [Mycena leptocephala]|nr:hypothetical protein B0H13DRAFT_2520831 [Mycena leptocephala]